MSQKFWFCALVLVLFVLPARAGENTATAPSLPAATATLSSQGLSKVQMDRLSQAYDRAMKRNLAEPEKTPVAGLGPSTGFGSLIGKMVMSLLLVVGSIYAFSYAARRWTGSALLSTTGPLKVLARQQISQKSSVYVVAAMDRFLIIGESPQGLTCLSQFDDSEENRHIRETWGWDGIGVKSTNRLYSPSTSPFGPSLRSHVDELEREMSRFQEVSS